MQIPSTLVANHRIVLDRFVAACRADTRVVAAFLGGSYAMGTADAHSDLDLYLITTDEDYAAFIAAKEEFIRRLGAPLFLEDWGTPHCCFFVLAGGTEGELWIGRAGRFAHIHGGPYQVLLDKQALLANANFPERTAERDEQRRFLQGQIMNFWHEVGHFSKALARGQIWFAYGSLETMRKICVNLARLRYNFEDAGVGDEPYFKIEQAMPVTQLAALQASFCPLEAAAIRAAGLVILQFYHAVATELAAAHDLPYPTELERLALEGLHQ
jgi:predicted nucleotidyltransferase